MIFSLITRIGMHGAKVGLWTPILVIKLKFILVVDISGKKAHMNDSIRSSSRCGACGKAGHNARTCEKY